MVITTFKSQFVSVFEDAYLEMLRNAYTRYASKTTLNIITHIYTHYTRISVTDMLANDKKLLSRYNAKELLGGITERLNE